MCAAKPRRHFIIISTIFNGVIPAAKTIGKVRLQSVRQLAVLQIDSCSTIKGMILSVPLYSPRVLRHIPLTAVHTTTISARFQLFGLGLRNPSAQN